MTFLNLTNKSYTNTHKYAYTGIERGRNIDRWIDREIQRDSHTHTHTHTHTHIYIYIYIYITNSECTKSHLKIWTANTHTLIYIYIYISRRVKTNMNISLVLFNSSLFYFLIFLLFANSFNLRLSSEEKILWKNLF